MKQKPKVRWSSLGGDILDIPKEKSKYVPKVYVEPEWLTEYLLKRDRVLWLKFPGSRKEIEQRHPKKVEVEDSQLKINL